MPEDIPSLVYASAEPGQDPRRPRPGIFFGEDGLRAGWSLLLFILLLGIFVSPVVIFLAHHQSTPAAAHGSGNHERSIGETALTDGALFLAVLLSSAIMARIEGRSLSAYGIGSTSGAFRQFLTGLGWGIFFLTLLIVALRSAHLLVFDGRLLAGVSILRYAMEWALTFLLVGLFEESLLRGYLQFTIARGISGIVGSFSRTSQRDAAGFWIAAIFLSFVFGVGHRSNPGESSIGIWAAGFVGLIFSLSLWRTGSLWWAIGFHTSWDWAQSFLYGVADSGGMMQHHLFATHPLGRPNLSGGLTGPEGSALVLPILVLVAVVIQVTLRQVPRPVPIARLGPAQRESMGISPVRSNAVSPP